MKTKRVTLSIILLVVIGLAVGYTRDRASTSDKTFMWKLDYQGHRSYILGSVHFLKKEMYPLPVQIEDAFTQSEILVVEADISANKMSQHLVLTMEKGMYKGEETLKHCLSETTYHLAEEVLKKHGMDIAFYQKFKPWLLALTISGIELMKMGYDPNFGVDKYFIDRIAIVNDTDPSSPKKIVELEGIPFQINLFDSFSKVDNDRFLFYSLQEVFQYQKEIQNLIMAWKHGDAVTMEKLLEVNFNQYTELASMHKIFIVDRNIAMADKIFAYLATGKIHFVVVGAAHLVGHQGILRLLEQKGVGSSQQ